MKTREGLTLLEFLIILAVLAIVAAAILSPQPHKKSIPATSGHVAEAMKVFEPNVPAILRVNILQFGGNICLEKIYCDLDGDANTVEQYVQAVTSDGFFIAGGGIENLVRKVSMTPYFGRVPMVRP